MLLPDAPKASLYGLLCCIALALLLGCEKPPVPTGAPLTISGSTMGTYYRVTLASTPVTISEDELRASIELCLDSINTKMSTYLADSEISRFNLSRDTHWFPVSLETATVVSEALEISQQSDGAFDITVGPLVNLWGFGPTIPTAQRIPNPETIINALEKTGSKHLQVRLNPPALKKDLAELQVDLSGIAKGFAVDSVAGVLEKMGQKDYLVDIGGELRAGGKKEDSPWIVAIERPDPSQRAIQKAMILNDLAIATSGDYRNYFEVEGHRYSHQIDPGTGRPIHHKLVSVSVVDASCMRADAWATAMMILGPQKGAEIARKAKLATLFIVHENGEYIEMKSPQFDQLSRP